jgi:hypothetical protein
MAADSSSDSYLKHLYTGLVQGWASPSPGEIAYNPISFRIVTSE